jgi:hypothetical protein
MNCGLRIGDRPAASGPRRPIVRNKANLSPAAQGRAGPIVRNKANFRSERTATGLLTCPSPLDPPASAPSPGAIMRNKANSRLRREGRGLGGRGTWDGYAKQTQFRPPDRARRGMGRGQSCETNPIRTGAI